MSSKNKVANKVFTNKLYTHIYIYKIFSKMLVYIYIYIEREMIYMG